MTAHSAPPRDLPVSVCLPDPLGLEVRAWVEGEIGWQVVPPEGPPRPLLTLRDAADARPGCVVVIDGEVDTAALRAALGAGAQDAVGWPGDRERLLEIVSLPASGSADGPPVWRVAGTGGGVGTSTVALAAAGLAAWSGRRVVAVGGHDLLGLCGITSWTGPGLDEIHALGPVDGGAEIEAVSRPVAGLDELSVLAGVVGSSLDVSGWPADLVVADRGVAAAGSASGGIDLLVTSPDARAARAKGIDAPLLVVGDGPLDAAGVRSAAGRRPAGWLPHSARVARAALQGRVPASLPGSWLRGLRDALGGSKRR